MSSQASGSDKVSGAFDLLAESVRRWIWKKGWTSLRDIQERAIPALVQGDQDLIISASTAAGKTEAAFLPLVSRVLAGDRQGGFDLVYIGPLRALINDQFGRLEDLCEALGIPVHPWHGDISQALKSKARKHPSGILLITPESLEAMFVLRGNEVPGVFQGTQAIVIDELHALLDSERGVHLRSLMTRLEIAVGRRVRRVGLSATLGDMDLARSYLRPEAPQDVELLESRAEGQELQVQIRGYLTGVDRETEESEDGAPEKQDLSAQRAISEHIFQKMRGANNLVFAGSRGRVELYSDLLRQKCAAEKVPDEFFPHHASLSRDHRLFVETRLKEGRLPTTAICTATLELGIDIGDVACVGQIGPPFSVADLRQRLGRSGRRPGLPSVLRMYAPEPRTNAESHFIDRLHLGLIRSIAMIELLVEGWCEPPDPHALHLSTLTHQILSVIAERGGASATRIFATLCDRGPFRTVDQALFARLLRRLGDKEVAMIEQAPDGTLLLGRQGERIVEHYSFYAVFQTPEEFRVVHDGKTLGTLPVDYPLAPNMTIIFSGRRWCILEVHDRERLILVSPDHAGIPPKFGGGGGVIHDKVVQRMRTVLAEKTLPAYLDKVAVGLLEAARSEFVNSRLDQTKLLSFGEDNTLVATWRGTTATTSLGLVLTGMGYEVSTHDGFLEVALPKDSDTTVQAALHNIANGKEDLARIVRPCAAGLGTQKFHPFIGDELLFEDALTEQIDLQAVPHLAGEVLSHS